MISLTPAERAMFREEAGLGVCSDPRREFGRDYRIIAVLDALDDAETSARQAWAVHTEHVDTTCALIARHAGDAVFERLRAEKAENKLKALERLLNESGVRHLQPPNWRSRVDEVLGWQEIGYTDDRGVSR